MEQSVKSPVQYYAPTDARDVDVRRFIENLDLEIAAGLFDADELALLHDERLYGKYLNPEKRAFFLYHFIPLWRDAVRCIFGAHQNPTIVDLGCGTGTSSLLFACLGARVLGVDLDPVLLSVCNKRKAFMENALGRPLAAEFTQADVRKFDIGGLGADVFYSMFAFRFMRPVDELLGRIAAALPAGGSVYLIDANGDSVFNRMPGRRRMMDGLRAAAVEDGLRRGGFATAFKRTYCCIPPACFGNRLLAGCMGGLEAAARAAGLHRYLGVTYSIGLRKRA